MDMLSKMPVSNEMKTYLVTVTSYEDKNLRGTLRPLQAAEAQSFRSTIDLLQRLDALQDAAGFPQRAMQPRSFPCGRAVPLADAPTEARAPLARFEIRVLFRHNASWQGNVAWLDRKSDAAFRSTLELLQLLDGALCAEPKTCRSAGAAGKGL